jgi:hypothetical protein
VKLDEVRAKLAAVLVPIEDTDPDVIATLVDTLEPPALLLGWGVPWLEPSTSCVRTARLVVTCVSSRIGAGAGTDVYEPLETLVAYVLDRTGADPGPWSLDSVTAPLELTFANTKYVAAQITLKIPVT